jgi:hypothetical protein
VPLLDYLANLIGVLLKLPHIQMLVSVKKQRPTDFDDQSH